MSKYPNVAEFFGLWLMDDFQGPWVDAFELYAIKLPEDAERLAYDLQAMARDLTSDEAWDYVARIPHAYHISALPSNFVDFAATGVAAIRKTISR